MDTLSGLQNSVYHKHINNLLNQFEKLFTRNHNLLLWFRVRCPLHRTNQPGDIIFCLDLNKNKLYILQQSII